MLDLSPTPFTAALAGLFSALALPAATRWLGEGSGDGMLFVVVFLIVVVLPAHAFVLGLRPTQGAPSRSVDRPLVVRTLAWVGAAVAGTLAPLALG
jgi:hypothetical protein